MPFDAIYVGRPSRWGNPWRVVAVDFAWEVRRTGQRAVTRHADKVWASRAAVQAFTDSLTVEDRAAARYELAGHDLVCWCPLRDADGQPWPCHADVLLRIANDR